MIQRAYHFSMNVSPLFIAHPDLCGNFLIGIKGATTAEIDAISKIVRVKLYQEHILSSIFTLQIEITVITAKLIHDNRIDRFISHKVVAHKVGMIIQDLDTLTVSINTLLHQSLIDAFHFVLTI